MLTKLEISSAELEKLNYDRYHSEGFFKGNIFDRPSRHNITIMEQNRMWELIAKKQAGEASPEEQLELSQQCAGQLSPGFIKQIELLWSASFNRHDDIKGPEIETAWNLLESRIAQVTPDMAVTPFTNLINFRKKKSFVKIRKFAVAACVFFLLAVSLWWLQPNSKTNEVTKNIVTTRNGSRTRLELPDGSKLWLNSRSRIIYNQSFGRTNRDIQLVGEAYFDVTHNTRLPFIIYTKNIIVKVLGTVFNVKAYAEDNITEASLVKGTIEVSFPGRPTEKLILHPSQKITLVNINANIRSDSILQKATSIKTEMPEMVVSKLSYNVTDSSIIETSWIANQFIFRNKEFSDLVKEMERWFNVAIEVHNDRLMQQRFTGTFYSGSSITEALDALKLTYPFSYRMDPKQDKLLILSP